MKKYKPIKFPEDEQAHNHIIEWWYWNGHVQDKNGNKYSFMSSFFKADAKKVKIPAISKLPLKNTYFYHSLVTDIKNKKYYPIIEEFSALSKDSFTKPLLYINHTSPIAITGYTNRVMEETKPFCYKIKDESMELNFVSKKIPLLEGGTGYVVNGPKNDKATYYYSLTSLKTEGKIKIKNQWIDVFGIAWMDHQWADVAYTKDKWTWFSIQLDNDIEIVCYKYGEVNKEKYLASISNKNGTTEHFTNVQIIPSKTSWTSTNTGATYPLSWKIIIPQKNISLEISALSKNQEMVFGVINYWEGPMSIEGTFNNKKVTGKGFTELVGYPTKISNFKQTQRKLKVIAKDAFKFAKKNIFK